MGSREAVRQAVLAASWFGAVFEHELVPDRRLRTLEITGADLSAVVSLVCLAERRELCAVWAFFEVSESPARSSGQAATC